MLQNPVAKYAILVITILMVLIVVDEIRRARSRAFTAFCLLALCYPMGKLAQIWMVGGPIVRYYLSDAGFVACTALYFMVRVRVRAASWVEASIVALRGARWGLTISAGVELLEIAFNPWLREIQLELPAGTPGPRGDWVDLGIYVVTYVLASRLLRQMTAHFRGLPSDAQPEPKRRSAVSKKDRRKKTQAR